MPTPEELASATPDDTPAPEALELIARPAGWTPAASELATRNLKDCRTLVDGWSQEPEWQP